MMNFSENINRKIGVTQRTYIPMHFTSITEGSRLLDFEIGELMEWPESTWGVWSIFFENRKKNSCHPHFGAVGAEIFSRSFSVWGIFYSLPTILASLAQIFVAPSPPFRRFGAENFLCPPLAYSASLRTFWPFPQNHSASSLT